MPDSQASASFGRVINEIQWIRAEVPVYAV